MKPMKARDMMRLLESKGWVHVRTSGSHFQYTKNGRAMTVVGPENNLVSPGVVRSNLKTIKEVG